MNKEINYNCDSFGHMLHQYYNRKNIGKDRRISYGNNTDNLKEKESFEDS